MFQKYILCLTLLPIVSSLTLTQATLGTGSNSNRIENSQLHTASTSVASNGLETIVAKSQEGVGPESVGTYSGYTMQKIMPGQPLPYSYKDGYYPGYPGQLFGLSSNGDFTLAAYFGPIIWGCLAGLVLSIFLIWLLNTVGGFSYVGTAFEGLKSEKNDKSTAKGRSYNLDNITKFLQTAIEKYAE